MVARVNEGQMWRIREKDAPAETKPIFVHYCVYNRINFNEGQSSETALLCESSFAHIVVDGF